MELDGSLPHSQEPVTCPYPEPDQSGLCPHPIPSTHFMNIRVTIKFHLLDFQLFWWKFWVQVLYIYIILQNVPLGPEPGIFNNFTTNEDIETKFEADYRHTLQTHTADTRYRHTLQTHTADTHYIHIPLRFSHNERTPVQISLQYLHWCWKY